MERAPGTAKVMIPFWWLAGAGLLILVALAVGIGVYASLPATVPTHWGADGRPDRFAAKSVWSVFGPLIMAAATGLFIVLLTLVIPAMPVRGVPSGDPAWDAQRLTVARESGSSLLGQLMFCIVASMCWISMASWVLPERPWTITVGGALLLVAVAVLLLRFLRKWGRLERERPEGTPSVLSATDDGHWKAKVFYVNKENPRFLVPRRYGVGWTMNLGHPAGAVLGGVLLVFLVGTVALLLSQAV
ncbi:MULTISPECIES: DUF1648 domain-containing protein [Arthrobacter]|uniref:DUF1648 domain-containing protein n=2 Tax=Arthrobacter TaxID=1663 RepID=A0ABU9KIK7_9MICC|nr:DUF1648 domain-containing protein [Arthrobacter sp. YJM1]MDP5227032.1 DUF1648 domain-containing protein [Arthrobacter sp. YJM1]